MGESVCRAERILVTLISLLLALSFSAQIVLFAGLTPLQKKLYKAVLQKNISAFDSQGKTRLNNILSDLRKTVNHPYLFPGVEPEVTKTNQQHAR